MIRVINGSVIITACMRLQFLFISVTFPSAEGLVKKKALISNLPKKSSRVISLSLFPWTAKPVSGSLHKVL